MSDEPTMAGNEPEVTKPTPDQYKQAILQMVQNLAGISKGIQEKAEGAKTSTKKKYYLKKLRKNNELLADMIIRLEHYNKRGVNRG